MHLLTNYLLIGNQALYSGVIFIIFVTALTVTKISNPQKFATKRRLVTVAMSVHVILVKCMASASNLLSICDHPFFYPYSRLIITMVAKHYV